MDALPPLQWMASLSGLVRGRQPGGSSVCPAELAKEWATPVYVCQLDLRQAFDKIKHSAVIAEGTIPSKIHKKSNIIQKSLKKFF